MVWLREARRRREMKWPGAMPVRGNRASRIVNVAYAGSGSAARTLNRNNK